MTDLTFIELILVVHIGLNSLFLGWIFYASSRRIYIMKLSHQLGEIKARSELTEKNLANFDSKIDSLKRESTEAHNQIGNNINTLRSDVRQDIGQVEGRLLKEVDKVSKEVDKVSKEVGQVGERLSKKVDKVSIEVGQVGERLSKEVGQVGERLSKEVDKVSKEVGQVGERLSKEVDKVSKEVGQVGERLSKKIDEVKDLILASLKSKDDDSNKTN